MVNYSSPNIEYTEWCNSSSDFFWSLSEKEQERVIKGIDNEMKLHSPRSYEAYIEEKGINAIGDYGFEEQLLFAFDTYNGCSWSDKELLETIIDSTKDSYSCYVVKWSTFDFNIYVITKWKEIDK